MSSILEDEFKFLTLGLSSKNNNTSKIESRIQLRLLQSRKDDLLSANVYDLIQPVRLSAAAHVRPAQNTQERSATPTHHVFDRL